MTDHLLLTHFDEHNCAILERQDGTTVTVPVEWLPEEAQPGQTLHLQLSPDGRWSAVRFELEAGNTLPEGVDVGA